MEFGFSLPSRGQAATMQNMRLLAQHVEALGLDSVWVSDHIIVPRQIDSFYPYDPEGRFPSAPDQDYYEPLTTLPAAVVGACLAACEYLVDAADAWQWGHFYVGDIPEWWLWVLCRSGTAGIGNASF